MSRWLLFLLVLPACDSEPPLCEVEDRATCTSSLRVNFDDGRTEFELTLEDDVQLNLNFRCPDEDEVPNEQNGYTWICSSGGVTIETDKFFGDEVTIRVGQTPPQTYELNLTRGGDFCGNVCNNASITL